MISRSSAHGIEARSRRAPRDWARAKFKLLVAACRGFQYLVEVFSTIVLP